MILRLAGSAEAQWKRFNAKLRNQIRKAERSGLRARFSDAADLAGFYSVFARNMRDLGTPVYGRAFFAEILSTFAESSTILLVESGKTLVASAIALRYRDTLEVPWAASLRQFQSLCPNNLLYWMLIKHAIRNGLEHFDFGRSSPGDGPYKFKAQWGAEPIPLVWEYWLPEGGIFTDISPQNKKYSIAIKFWKSLPLALTNRMGPAVVRGIP
jgi:FemAB-related protein (PEP-CTERM system-associated)